MLASGVMLGSLHTYRDWGLFLMSKPTISPPKAKTVYISIPSSDGKLDMTESLTNDVKYDNRKITMTFKLVGNMREWDNIYSDIQDYLHGQRMRITFDSDNSFFYIGRLEVNSWKSKKQASTIVIEGDVDPYKYELFSSLEDWEWDTFDFETGIIREYKDLEVYGERELVIPCRRKQVVPSFNVAIAEGKTMAVVYEGVEYGLGNGINTILNIVLPDGDNTLLFKGYGAVSVDYRGARL